MLVQPPPSVVGRSAFVDYFLYPSPYAWAMIDPHPHLVHWQIALGDPPLVGKIVTGRQNRFPGYESGALLHHA